MSSINPRWLTSTVVDLASAIAAERAFDRLPILADALMDAGCDNEQMLAACRAGQAPAGLLAELDTAAQAAKRERTDWLRGSVAFRAGLLGGSQWTISHLATRITRRRPRGSGSKTGLAQRLRDALDARAAKAWAAACKGQRGPTPNQAAQLYREISGALDSVQGRCTQRTIGLDEVICAARDAIADGLGDRDGGGVAKSYGYPAGSSYAAARRQADGSILLRIGRTVNGGNAVDVSAPAKHFADITVDSAVLKGGGNFGVRKPHGWDCYYSTGRLCSVAIPAPKDIAAAFGCKWEHGATLAAARAELTRKAEILTYRAIADELARETSELQSQVQWLANGTAERRAEAARQARNERRAQLLARLGNNALVGYHDLRELGACDAGIRAFAARNGIPEGGKAPLPLIAKTEPAWALKIARKILSARS
jgi:hypothetical protein